MPSIDRRAGKGLFISVPLLIAAFFLSKPLFTAVLILTVAHLAFFRDPAPQLSPGDAPVSPAYGTVCEVETCFEDRFLKEEAVKIGIFLSIFDVHVNRSPVKGTVRFQQYEPGKFMNALNKECSKVNECNWIGIEGDRKCLVRQVSGAIARRIHTDVKPGSELERGAKLGIICYGSRTEFYAPKRLFKPAVAAGQSVKAGETILGEWIS